MMPSITPSNAITTQTVTKIRRRCRTASSLTYLPDSPRIFAIKKFQFAASIRWNKANLAELKEVRQTFPPPPPPLSF